jgi:acyl carrier protein
MKKQEIEKMVIDILKTYKDIQHLDEITDIENCSLFADGIGMNSVRYMDFICKIEEVFLISISVKQSLELETLEDIVDFILTET